MIIQSGVRVCVQSEETCASLVEDEKKKRQTLGRSKSTSAKKNDKGSDDHEKNNDGKEEIEADHCLLQRNRQ